MVMAKLVCLFPFEAAWESFKDHGSEGHGYGTAGTEVEVGGASDRI